MSHVLLDMMTWSPCSSLCLYAGALCLLLILLLVPLLSPLALPLPLLVFL